MPAYSSIELNKRVEILDILRGFALFGILFVNANDYRLAIKPGDPGFNELNVWFNNIIIATGDGSFYPLFSLLFGIGFAIWMDRSLKVNGGVWRFAWRSFILLLLGCLFFIFIEDRNILIRYSILSIPLLLFYNARPKTLLIGALIFLMLAVFHRPLWTEINKRRSPDRMMQLNKQQHAIDAAWHKADQNKDYLSFCRARSMSLPGQIKMSLTFSHVTLPLIFSMFLLGVFSWRKGYFLNIEKYNPFWRRLFWWGLIIGLGGNAYVFVMRILGFKKIFTPDGHILSYVETIANPALTFFYISAFALALQKRRNRSFFLFTALSNTGKIPLTNYFLQYIIMSILMLPYGFNLDARLFSQHLLLVSIGVFILQLVFSSYWTKRFISGPMEWLWRSLTYLRVQILRKPM